VGSNIKIIYYHRLLWFFFPRERKYISPEAKYVEMSETYSGKLSFDENASYW
jgi:hypothetical protein